MDEALTDRVPPLYSDEWFSWRGARWTDKAEAIVDLIEQYEDEHPDAGDGAACLAKALSEARTAIRQARGKDS